MIHTGEHPYSCSICQRSFKQSSNLTKHMLIHSNTTPFVCPHPQCNGKGFYRKDSLQNHLGLCHGAARKHPCSQCSKGYSTKGMLEDHIRSVHTKATPFRCRVCFKAFSRFNSCRDHEKRHTVRFRCEACKRDFTSKFALKKHKCGIRRARWGFRAPAKTRAFASRAERPYPCKKCNWAFSSKENLTTHFKLHSPKNPNVCRACSRPFLCPAYLAKHMKKIHDVETEGKRDWRSNKRMRRPHKDIGFSCAVCFAIFEQRSSFRQHMKSHNANNMKSHDANNVKTCTVCETSFNSAADLREHLQSHLVGGHVKRPTTVTKRARKRKWSAPEKKEFPCALCSSSFMLQNTLNKHMLIHHSKCT